MIAFDEAGEDRVTLVSYNHVDAVAEIVQLFWRWKLYSQKLVETAEQSTSLSFLFPHLRRNPKLKYTLISSPSTPQTRIYPVQCSNPPSPQRMPSTKYQKHFAGYRIPLRLNRQPHNPRILRKAETFSKKTYEAIIPDHEERVGCFIGWWLGG